MSRYSNRDRYVDPIWEKNRFGITDEATLVAIEASLVALRSYALASRALAGRFDLAHLRAIHQYVFGDVYDCVSRLGKLTPFRLGF
jgi:cell filamentation protein